jgi:putative flippase GtrA
MNNDTFFQRTKARILRSSFGRLFIDRKFFIYTCIGVFFAMFNVFLLWLFIDVLKIPTVIASSIVIGGTFIFRYVLFKIFGLV